MGLGNEPRSPSPYPLPRRGNAPAGMPALRMVKIRMAESADSSRASLGMGMPRSLWETLGGKVAAAESGDVVAEIAQAAEFDFGVVVDSGQRTGNGGVTNLETGDVV